MGGGAGAHTCPQGDTHIAQVSLVVGRVGGLVVGVALAISVGLAGEHTCALHTLGAQKRCAPAGTGATRVATSKSKARGCAALPGSDSHRPIP